MTSRNLEFSHCADVWVSYGEETITESNLLEIRRRHPEHVRVRTFPKQVEATNGADWEWRIVGLKRTLRMRVQAKRVQSNGVLEVEHTVKSSGKKQRDLLIAGAVAEGMKPVYCIYCTEPQRSVWTEDKAPPGFGSLQTRLPSRRRGARARHHDAARRHQGQVQTLASPVRTGRRDSGRVGGLRRGLESVTASRTTCRARDRGRFTCTGTKGRLGGSASFPSSHPSSLTMPASCFAPSRSRPVSKDSSRRWPSTGRRTKRRSTAA